jgi:hypothetical protein
LATSSHFRNTHTRADKEQEANTHKLAHTHMARKKSQRLQEAAAKKPPETTVDDLPWEEAREGSPIAPPEPKAPRKPKAKRVSLSLTYVAETLQSMLGILHPTNFAMPRNDGNLVKYVKSLYPTVKIKGKDVAVLPFTGLAKIPAGTPSIMFVGFHHVRCGAPAAGPAYQSGAASWNSPHPEGGPCIPR